MNEIYKQEQEAELLRLFRIVKDIGIRESMISHIRSFAKLEELIAQPIDVDLGIVKKIFAKIYGWFIKKKIISDRMKISYEEYKLYRARNKYLRLLQVFNDK
ncbi:MAG: hypothetical protein FWE72_09335 [Spirochaetaceae bacterium]|nr:hypothetical protein [Spirochaetaceae bacterium]